MIRFTFGRPLTPPEYAPLVAVPGVEVARTGELRVPENAGALIARAIDAAGLPVVRVRHERPPAPALSWEQCRAVLRAGGEVRAWVLEPGWLYPFQQDAVASCSTLPGGYLFHPTGAGKSITLLLWALLVPGLVVVCTGAKARIQWGRVVRRFTHVEPHVIAPRGYLRKGEQPPDTLEEYLARRREARERAVVIVGWEALRQHSRALAALRPVSFGMDEVHRAQQSRRHVVEAIPDLGRLEPDARARWEQHLRGAVADGAFVKHEEDTGEDKLISPADNIAAHAARVRRASKRACASDATPLYDRLKGLWGQLDLCEPKCWGNRSSWLVRYADRHRDVNGHFDDNGESNGAELVERMRYSFHAVSYVDAHRHLPAKRREAYYVPQSEQVAPGGGYRDMLRKAKKAGPSAVLWVGLAEACSRKRKAVLYLAGEHVGGGQSGKVIVFTGTHDDCDALGAAARKEWRGKGVQVWAAHGESSGAARQAILDEYVAHPGPCVLIGTWDAWGESLDGMQCTDALIFAMLPWSPGKVRQGEGRVCVAAGQVIPTLEGAKRVDDVRVGDYVLTHAGRWLPVRHVHSRALKSAYGGRDSALTTLDVLGLPEKLAVTSDHKLLVSVDGAEPTWMEAGRVTVGDELVTPKMAYEPEGTCIQVEFPREFRLSERSRNSARYPSMPLWVTIDEEVAWVFGHIAGDGWTSSSTSHYVGIAGNVLSVTSDLNRAVAVFARWGIKCKLRAPAKPGKSANLYAYGKELASWCRHLFGTCAVDKRVPPMVFSWPRKLKEAFIQGYLDADGYLRPDHSEYSWTTVSPHLAYGIQLLLDSCGLMSSTAKVQPRPEAPNAQYRGYVRINGSRLRQDARFVYRRVNATSTVGAGSMRDSRVFDLSVPGDESFVVEGVAVHNCRSGQTRPVVIYYVIAAGTADERVVSLLLPKFEQVGNIAQDEELAEAGTVVAGRADREGLMRSIFDAIGVPYEPEVCDDPSAESGGDAGAADLFAEG